MTRESLPNAAPLSCDEALRQIDCLVEEGSLKNAERAFLMAHLEGCTACRAVLERRRQLDARLREVFAELDTRPDFTQRLLARIPGRQAGTSSAWRPASSRAISAQGSTGKGAQSSGANQLSSKTIVWPVAASILLLMSAWWFTRGTGTTVPLPTVATASSMLVEREGRERLLTAGYALAPGDELTVRIRSEADADTGSCEMTSQGQRLCAIRLAAGARLLVHSRGHYELRRGEAYFEVNPDRPNADEGFDVETPFGHVLVKGTSFGIIVASAQASTVTVVVDSGVVNLKPLSGQSQTVAAGQECDLKSNGGTSLPRRIAALRLPRLRSTEVAVSPAPPTISPRPSPKQAQVVDPVPHVNFAAGVGDLDFRGCTLARAIQRLGERLGSGAEWPLLVAEADRLAPEGTSALLLYGHPLTAGDVLSWLAREQGLRFSPPVSLRVAAPDEALGPPQSGEIPPDLNALLDAATTGLPEEMSAAAALEALSASTGLVTLPGKVDLGRVPRRPTWRGILEQLSLSHNLDWAWYDRVIYVASREEIELLTRQPRSDSVSRWLGTQPLPAWDLALKRVLSGVTVDARGHLALCDQGLLSNVALYPDERGIQYVSGVRGVRVVDALYRMVNAGSPLAADPTAVMNELEATGTYRTLDELVTSARRRAPVVWEGERCEFPMQAFAVRRMPLGRALERGAWLHGLGLRLEPGRIVVDTARSCYGDTLLQAISLEAAVARLPRTGFKLPSTLAREAQACWPEILKDVAWMPMNRTLLFTGDARQLAAVQKVAHGLESALQDPAFDADRWQLPWRAELAQNLAEPFRGDGTGTLPGGSFVGVLRGSGMFIPLKAEILVDPLAMKELATRQIGPLDVGGRTMGQVLERLAQAAGLRMVIEDEVIWLKPR